MRLVTSFISREPEIDHLVSLLENSNLVTITGAGGIGKTRLSLETGNRIHESYPDGAWFLDLSAADSGDAVAPLVATDLEIPDQSSRPSQVRVVDYLRSKSMLLILDNCEHVVPAVSELAYLILTECPDVKMIATSRCQLGVPGEKLLHLEPLSLPSADTPIDSAALAKTPAVAMFVERAHAADPAFELTTENASDIASICRRLDGIPLALELAAARIRSIGTGEFAERLEHQFSILQNGPHSAPSRQQTLENAVKWSYDLISPQARLLWNRISVFPDTFDLSAAENICGFTPLSTQDVYPLLDDLVRNSVLRVERDRRRVRYRQFVSTKLYGQQQLSAEEATDLQARHREFFHRRAAEMAAHWPGPNQLTMLEMAREGHSNTVLALEHAYDIREDPNAAAEHVAALRYQWVAGLALSEGRNRIEQFLALPGVTGASRGELLWVGAWVSLIQGDHDRAGELVQECWDLAEELDNVHLKAHARCWTALYHVFTGSLEQAIPLFGEALSLFDDLDDTAAELIAGFQHAMALELSGAHNEALEVCAQAFTFADESGERWNRAHFHWVAGMAHFSLGQWESGREHARQGLEISADFQDGIVSSLIVELQSWIESAVGNHELASSLATAADDIWRAQGTSVQAFGPAMKARSVKARGPLVLEAQQVPRSKQDAIAFALSTYDTLPEPATANAPKVEKNSPLTRREREVAELVGSGMTNRQVADKLVISTRTVEGHVENIFSKLQINNRSQIAVWLHG